MSNKEYNYTEELKKLKEFKKSLKAVKDFLNLNENLLNNISCICLNK